MLAQMREYVGRNGNNHFSGYMGRTKLVLLQDRDAECTGAEVACWTFHVEEAPLPDGAGRQAITSRRREVLSSVRSRRLGITRARSEQGERPSRRRSEARTRHRA